MKTKLIFATVFVSLSLMACGGKTQKIEQTQETKTEQKPVSVDGPSTSQQTGVGSVSGIIRFDGVVPNLQKINMAADPKCVANNTGDVLPEILVLGDNQTLANVLVKITKGHEGIATTPATEPVVLDQKGCKYFPHVLGVQKDQPVKILNSDGTLHNVHILAVANGEHNEAMPAFRKEIEKTFAKVEPAFSIKCDVHPWMKSYVEVFDHPFFTTTKPDGQYKIENLPAGTYELSFWHEKLGQQSTTLTVVASENTVFDINWKAPESSAKLEFVQLANWQ